MLSATAQQTSSAITLKGSVEIVSEFFYFGINSILYQRGIYPAETFERHQQYGLSLLVTTDEKLKNYLKDIGNQIKAWLSSLVIQKLVLVIRSVATQEILERWQFNIECDKGYTEGKKSANKSEKSIRSEICDVIRQITASVTFLPLLEDTCSFDILVYTDKDSEVPESWADSDPHFVANSQEVKLRSFNTLIHKIDTMVSYKES